MFYAKEFSYAGRPSTKYNLLIAEIDGSNVVETDSCSFELNAVKASASHKFIHAGINVGEAPTCEISLIRQEPIPASLRGEILSWLLGKPQFEKLTFKKSDNSTFTFYCVFTHASNIYVNGYCRGFRLTMTMDSIYARGTPTEIKIKNPAELTSVQDKTHTVRLLNNSQIIDGYTYPFVEFSGAGITIVNETDDSSRAFTVTPMDVSAVTKIDNEAMTIKSTSSNSTTPMYGFGRRWLRLKNGYNNLKITLETPGAEARIVCPHYALIGF